MKAFLTLSLWIVSSLTFANTTIDQILGPCKKEFPDYLLEAKKVLINNSIWNYDNDYHLQDVKSSTSTNARQRLINVYVYFNIDGLRDKGYTFSFKPIFPNGSRSACSYINIELIREH